MTELFYRDANLNDLPKIVEIYNSTIPTLMVTADTEVVSVESRIDWFHDHTPDRRPLWIVENPHKEIFGWVSFQSFYGRPAYNSTAEISIYLHETARGKGIGKQVLQYAIDHCGAYQIKTLLGFIFAHNEQSLKLFHSLGFEEWATLPDVAMLDGIERTLKIVGRRIV
jgi:phosphinothricin acetyltransferase